MSWVIQAADRVSVVCFMAGGSHEGYCAGGARTDQPGNQYDPSYWPTEWREGDWALVAVNVSSELAQRLEDMGTDKQDFGDGYEAWRAVLAEDPNGGEVIYEHKEEEGEE